MSEKVYLDWVQKQKTTGTTVKKVGEIMLRLSTPNNEKFIRADEFDVNYGGGGSKCSGVFG